MAHLEADPRRHVDSKAAVAAAGQSEPLADHHPIMTEPRVALQLNAPAPADVSALPAGIVGDGAWLRFFTPRAAAMVYVPTNAPSSYLLHWIESTEKGHGTAVMRSLGRWADEYRMTGSLTCQRPMVAWYRRFGWEIIRPYFEGYIMARYYTEELKIP